MEANVPRVDTPVPDIQRTAILDSVTIVTYFICVTLVSLMLEPYTMPGLTSRTRAQGASVVTTLPAEVTRRLGIEAGQELDWIEDGMGGFRVVRRSEPLAEAMAIHEELMAEYDSAFRALAK